jgi:hypothetical protein
MTLPAMTVSASDKNILRELARRVAEIAALPIQAQRRERWKQHNSLRSKQPMIMIFPEGSWREILPEASLQCESQTAREMELALRRPIYQHDHFDTDMVVENTWDVPTVIRSSGWGLEAQWHFSEQEGGARAFSPVISTPADLKKLKHPDWWIDEAATAANVERTSELFGDVLDVRRVGVKHISFHLMSHYTSLRGLEQVMMDMIESPEMLHEAMAFLTEGHKKQIRRYEELNLLCLNNDGSYHSTGGNGYTDELPADGFDPLHVRPCDVWASAESQELAQVSPEMHREFALNYERQLLEPFGLNGYGCCEDLTRKLDDVMAVPNMRRISISPWADVPQCAEKLQDKFIFSWKPHPAQLAGTFSPDRVRQYLGDALGATRGCVMEMILKDTHTCDHHPERFTEWSKIARELVEESR